MPDEETILIQRFMTGKNFYMELDGKGRNPVMHFGMTGMLQVKGELPFHYKETSRKATIDWPPRFMKVSSQSPTYSDEQALISPLYIVHHAR